MSNRQMLWRLLTSVEEEADQRLLARITNELVIAMADLADKRVLAILQSIADTAKKPPPRMGKIEAILAAVQSVDVEIARIVRKRVGLCATTLVDLDDSVTERRRVSSSAEIRASDPIPTIRGPQSVGSPSNVERRRQTQA